jgi:hypothetical protein
MTTFLVRLEIAEDESTIFTDILIFFALHKVYVSHFG